MAFQVSPGVQVKEVDLTNVIPAVSSSVGAIAGKFGWGPVLQSTLVTSEKELVQYFGKPLSGHEQTFMLAAQFLQYGNALKVVRGLGTDSNAASGGSSVVIRNAEHYPTVSLTGVNWIAKYPGLIGNSLTVEVCTAANNIFNGWTYNDEFSTAPTTSVYGGTVGATNDEMHVVVVDTGGKFSGVPGTILEKFAYLSQGKDARKEDGSTNYYADVINNQSNYIWFGDHLTALTEAGETLANRTFTGLLSVSSLDLSAGSDGAALTAGQEQVGYNIFDDSDTESVDLIIGTQPFNVEATAVTHSNNLIAIAEKRKDAVVFLSPFVEATNGTSSTPLTDVMSWANQLTSSSYAVIDSTALYVYDKYADVYRWIPASGAVAGLCANTDNVADAWFSPAGLNRGQLLGVTKIGFNPKKAERDTLYQGRVNPIVSFPGEGTVLFGDKTALARPSAFDRINVRRLFIILEKAISTASRFQLFEFNDEFTRAQFRNLVEPFLRDVKGRRGITDFLVVCDETNNTGNVIDSNQFVADIYIKPARSINFITLNFIATRSGVEFSEIVGQ